jgi:hypothetical protein
MYSAPTAPPGWYPDPAGRYERRYWSGSEWTDQVDGNGELEGSIVAKLGPANTSPNWLVTGAWQAWNWPSNLIHGESFRQEAISCLPGLTPGRADVVRCDPVEIEFVREPTNPHDQNACRAVVANIQVGYLARDHAAAMAPQVDAAGVTSWRVCGAVVGGSEAVPSYGVHVWIDRRLTDGPVGQADSTATGVSAATAAAPNTLSPYDHEVSLATLRIPNIASGFPDENFLLAFDGSSPQLPSEKEALIIASYIDYKRSWSSVTMQQRMLSEPYDVKPGFNTIVLHKKAANQWTFRRSSWTGKWPPRGGWCSLVELLDGEQSLGEPEPAVEWITWKTKRPWIFGEG